MRGRIIIAVAAMLTAAAAGPQPDPSVTKTVGDTTVQVGRVFGDGGTDGLILYALILANFLTVLTFIAFMVFTARSSARRDAACEAQSKAFAEASQDASEALKDVATAIASSASADMTFKQSMASLIGRANDALQRFEARS